MPTVMGTILLTFCSISQPAQCVDRAVPLYSMQECMMAIVKAPSSEIALAHPNWRFTRWRCVFGKPGGAA